MHNHGIGSGTWCKTTTHMTAARRRTEPTAILTLLRMLGLGTFSQPCCHRKLLALPRWSFNPLLGGGVSSGHGAVGHRVESPGPLLR
eukprot:753523-Hanusia_phi.AAC.4